LLEDLTFGSGRVRRFTQDSPVLPDVWLEYADVTRRVVFTDILHVPTRVVVAAADHLTVGG
jgi:hypothetical protein